MSFTSRFVLAILTLTSSAAAQSVRGVISGTVHTAGGGPAASVELELIQEETGRQWRSATGPAGEFLFTLLPPSSYRLEVTVASQPDYVQRLTLLVNQEIRVDIELPRDRPADTVEVRAPRALLKPESASMGSVIENHQIRGLPLDGRNFLELALLLPGVAPPAQGSAGSVRGAFAVNVNGAREDGNMFLLDGVYNGDPKLNGFGVNSSVDAIQEFEVGTSSYDASFGRNGGAQVNIVVKSGANEIHGTVYEFFRNSTLDARNFFAPAGEPAPRFQRNQFGFSLGGPVIRNRTFWFGNYEGRRVREGTVRLTRVPTMAERGGDFSASGIPFLIDPFTQQPFPGSRIPQQRIHPVGANIAALYPLPNRAGAQNFVSSPAARDRGDQFDVRLDHQLARGSDLAARYSMTDRSFYEPFAGQSFAAVPGFGVNVPSRSHNLMIGETHTFSPGVLNEFRAGFIRTSLASLQENVNRNLNAQVGLPVLSDLERRNGLSFITLVGYSPVGDEFNNPQQSATNTFQLIDNLTWVRNRHVLKFGYEFRRVQQNAFRDVQSRGFLNFFGFTGNAVADLLQGLPGVTGRAILDNPQYLRTWSQSFFVNDNWRVTQRLTLNLGLRYEFNSPPVDRFDRANLFDATSGQLAPVGQGAMPRAGYVADRNNFAPRVGLSYALDERGRTLLRTGYGFYFDQSPLAPGEGLYFSPPYFDFRLFFSLPQFPLTLSDPFPAQFPFPTPPSALAFQRDLRTPYMQHWNLNVQRQLGTSNVLEIGYVGSKGTKLLSARDFNQSAPSPAEFNPRPNPMFDDVAMLESRASSNYHSLQVRMQRRLSRGVSALMGYTWAKSIDDASGFFSSSGDPNFPQDSRNAAAERGRSNFDVRQRLTASYSWELPFGQGRHWATSGLASHLFGGWQTFGVWSFQTGRPFTVALLPELDNSGTGRSVLGFGANDRPHVLSDPRLARPMPERWFDTGAFSIPEAGNFGNAGRNILDGPGLQTINASLTRMFGLGERADLQFRAEVFNLLNRTNLDLPDNFLPSPTFGAISTAGQPRRIQLGLKILF